MAPENTLELVKNGEVLFSSRGRWLHPLFELEQFLKARRIDPRGVEVRDKIVGRGSAFLIVRMGIRNVHAGLLSRLGKDILDRAKAACRWESLVDRIQCRTEELLQDTVDPEQAYKLLAELARKDAAAASAPPGPS